MTLAAADGTDLHLQPTEELAFAGAHLGSLFLSVRTRNAPVPVKM